VFERQIEGYMHKLLILSFTMLLCSCGSRVDVNSKPLYGETGLPKNCRAIIATNIKAWREKQYSSEDVLESIDRNCGERGYSWDVK
jgi:hypothetical protein